MVLAALLLLLACFVRTAWPQNIVQATKPVPVLELYPEDPAISMIYEPPSGYLSVTLLGLFAMVPYPRTATSKIYYSFESININFNDKTVYPTYPGICPAGAIQCISSSYLTLDSPYVHINMPFGAQRNRTVTLIAVDEATQTRSAPIVLWFLVEADARPNAYGFLVPGVETQGYFLKFSLEMKAAARAQAAGGQEFADFNTDLGVGTYAGQLFPMRLPAIDKDLTGFEGGFSVNCSDGRQYGILVPFHTGRHFSGKVVVVDLTERMDNATNCMNNLRFEYYNSPSDKTASYRGQAPSAYKACVTVLDLASKNPNARGFRRGFVRYPYAFLSPSEFSVAVRLDVCRTDFGLDKGTDFLDLGAIDKTLGGYQGGFADGNWACFSPMKTFVGPFGGIRSSDAVDNARLLPFFHGRMVCVDKSMWTEKNSTRLRLSPKLGTLYTVDFSTVSPDLRGFSEAVRVGRFAYFAPLSSAGHTYSSKLVKLYLGETDVGTMLGQLARSGGDLRDIVDTLDLSQAKRGMFGFSGIFSSGQYLFLVPYRNSFEPRIGQRGHGFVTRVNMNQFQVAGIDYIETETHQRAQIPSTADDDLRGFSCGFASGKYQVFVPFFNGLFSGKLARLQGTATPLTDLQELDLQKDRLQPNIFKAFRGGFVSLWPGV